MGGGGGRGVGTEGAIHNSLEGGNEGDPRGDRVGGKGVGRGGKGGDSSKTSKTETTLAGMVLLAVRAGGRERGGKVKPGPGDPAIT